MSTQVELTAIDLRYEDFRLKSASQEKLLLNSIASRGIEQALTGILAPGDARPVLLDGFKRLRCARRLGMGLVPFVALAEDAAGGILALLRLSQAAHLSLLEQARLVDELKRVHQMSIAEISSQLERSKAWVVVRIDTLSKMSVEVRREVFSGRFPAYSYLYTLRQFRRLTHAKQSEEDEFVVAASGKQLSTRDIELLARGYFQGGETIRGQIREGKLGWCLGELKRDWTQASEGAAKWSEIERGTLRDLEMVARAMGRLGLRLDSPELGSSGYFAEAGLLASGVLRRIAQFEAKIRRFYDRCRETSGGNDPTHRGSEYPRDFPEAQAQPQHGPRDLEGAGQPNDSAEVAESCGNRRDRS